MTNELYAFGLGFDYLRYVEEPSLSDEPPITWCNVEVGAPLSLSSRTFHVTEDFT